MSTQIDAGPLVAVAFVVFVAFIVATAVRTGMRYRRAHPQPLASYTTLVDVAFGLIAGTVTPIAVRILQERFYFTPGERLATLAVIDGLLIIAWISARRLTVAKSATASEKAALQ